MHRLVRTCKKLASSYKLAIQFQPGLTIKNHETVEPHEQRGKHAYIF